MLSQLGYCDLEAFIADVVPDDILDALKKKKLGLPGIDFEVQEDRNAMQMGEFEVIKELLAAYPAAKIAKAQVKSFNI